MKKLKKWQLFSIIGVAVVVVVGAISAMFLSNMNSTTEPTEVAPIVQQAKEGSIASSVLLTGTVTANSEQYVYYDATKGDLESVLVNVGDQVAVGAQKLKQTMMPQFVLSIRLTVRLMTYRLMGRQ